MASIQNVRFDPKAVPTISLYLVSDWERFTLVFPVIFCVVKCHIKEFVRHLVLKTDVNAAKYSKCGRRALQMVPCQNHNRRNGVKASRNVDKMRGLGAEYLHHWWRLEKKKEIVLSNRRISIREVDKKMRRSPVLPKPLGTFGVSTKIASRYHHWPR